MTTDMLDHQCRSRWFVKLPFVYLSKFHLFVIVSCFNVFHILFSRFIITFVTQEKKFGAHACESFYLKTLTACTSKPTLNNAGCLCTEKCYSKIDPVRLEQGSYRMGVVAQCNIRCLSIQSCQISLVINPMQTQVIKDTHLPNLA